MPSGRACASIPRQTYLLPSAICTMNATSRVWWDAPAASSPRPGSAVWSWGKIPKIHLFFFFFFTTHIPLISETTPHALLASFLLVPRLPDEEPQSKRDLLAPLAGFLKQYRPACVWSTLAKLAPCHAKGTCIPAMPHPGHTIALLQQAAENTCG